MQGTLSQPLDVMAVITDKAARTTEAVNIDQVFVVEFHFSVLARQAQFTVAFGGKDSLGRLHTLPGESKGTRVSIPDPQFSALFMPDGQPPREFTKALMDTVFIEGVLPACNKLVWHKDEVEIAVDGEVAFKKVKGRDPLTKEEIADEKGQIRVDVQP